MFKISIIFILPVLYTLCYSQGNIESPYTHPIELNLFEKYVQTKDKEIQDEFKTLDPPARPLRPWEIAKLPNNLLKHRYYKEPDLLLTYDHTRVHLDTIQNEPGSDFIAANWVDSYDHPKRFIGTQCPMNSTARDFWRMVWQYGAQQVVNLASPHDMEIGKCFNYFMEKETQFGEILVKYIDNERMDDVIVRNFMLEKGKESRPLTHLHFQSWPDLGVPNDPKQLWNLIKRYRMDHLYTDKKPLVVHCVGGVGRTGTFLLTDSMFDMSKKADHLDFYKHLWTIRNQRISMVEKPEQYAYSHKTINEALNGVHSHPIKTNDFEKYVQNMETEIQNEFILLNPPAKQLMPWETAKLPRNIAKHRYYTEPDLLLTYDQTRVELDAIPNEPGSDFIAANWVDSYDHPKRFIGTQCPMNSTARDFWRMVWQYGAQQVVNLASPHDMENNKCFNYFMEKDMQFGDILLKYIDKEDIPDVTVRNFVLEKGKESRQLTHLHFQSWPDLGTPKDPNQLWNLIKRYRSDKLYSKKIPLVVHCVGGVGRTGTFLLTDSMLDMSTKEEHLDFFKHLWLIRHQRISMVEKPEQYAYSHKTIVVALNGAMSNVQTSLFLTFVSTFYMLFKN